MNGVVNAFQHSVLWNGRVSPAVTLTEGDQARSPAYIIADLVTVCAALAMAGSLEFQTRVSGVLTAVLFATLGLALYAAPPSIATTSAGQVFYGIGFTGLRLLIDVLIADTTDFRHRAVGYAFISSPWAITAFAVPAMRRSLSVSQLRIAISAFAGTVLFCGIVLFAFLQRYRRRAVDFEFVSGSKRLVRALRGFATGFARRPSSPQPREHTSSGASVAILRLYAQWRLRLPGTTIFVVVALLVVFLVLWLVQMSLLPWYTPIPFVVLFFGILAFLVALKNLHFKMRVADFLVEVEERLARLAPASPTDPFEDLQNSSTRSLRNRLYRKENADGTGDSILGPLRSKNMVAACALAVLWK